VDEYQDTSEKVIAVLMDHIYNAGGVVIGFFGDKMQSIYSDGVGELPATALARLEIIPKEQNYRCSQAVIDVLNKIRTDIQQYAAGDNLAGKAVYINLSNWSLAQ
jgi:DNA helicase-2/ATP-dependent DNA helicase PcrA